MNSGSSEAALAVRSSSHAGTAAEEVEADVDADSISTELDDSCAILSFFISLVVAATDVSTSGFGDGEGVGMVALTCGCG